MKTSAGLLVYRFKDEELQILIVHPGGPIWAKKDEGVWSLPKGLVDEGEDVLEAAKREFEEETGFTAPQGEYISLGEVTYPKGDKKVCAWAVEGDFDPSMLVSNTFEMQWPPKSGKRQEFPEIDRGEWVNLQEATKKLFPPNTLFLERLSNELHASFGPEEIPEPPSQGSLF